MGAPDDVRGSFEHYEVPCPLCMCKIGEDCRTPNGPRYVHGERAELAAGYAAGREDAAWTFAAVQGFYDGPTMPRVLPGQAPPSRSRRRKGRVMAGSYRRQELGGLFAPHSPASDARTAHQIDAARQAAERRKERALRAAERPQLDGWRNDARAFLRSYLVNHAELFPPDLPAAGLPPMPEGASAKAVGAVIVYAIRNGWMEQSGEYRRSPSSNMSPKPVYRSLIYRGEVGEAS